MDRSWWRVLTKRGPLEKGMANHFRILALRTPWTVWKGKKIRALKDELPRLVGAQYATRDQWRNNSRKNEDGACSYKHSKSIHTKQRNISVTADNIIQWAIEMLQQSGFRNRKDIVPIFLEFSVQTLEYKTNSAFPYYVWKWKVLWSRCRNIQGEW